ncbi:McrC family protein [Viridibacillus sp. NPDC093762]|uniref:McrC family protein n=1 Tax=Viridibacillus sp. NPDC093762 TaxID=3390720 RepID=UPI003D0833B2
MDVGLITVYEDQTTTLNLSTIQLEELQSFDSIIGSQNLIVRANNRITIKKYVGFIVTKHLKIQVLPKILKDPNSHTFDEYELRNQATKLFFGLLQYTNFLKAKQLPSPNSLEVDDRDILEIFIRIFVENLLQEIKRNMFNSYQRVEENSAFIKGKINYKKSIAQNYGMLHQHVINYEVFSENNLLNKIFKSITLQLIKVTNNKKNKGMLLEAIQFFHEVERVKLTKETFQLVKFNRLNSQYEPIFNLAKLFYYNQLSALYSGTKFTFSLMIPLNVLFEKTIVVALKNSSDLQVMHQSPQKFLVSSPQKYLMKPDITVIKDNEIVAILDAKYKNPITQGKVQISQTDLYQMVTYGVMYNCSKILLIYPLFKGQLKNDDIVESYTVNTPFNALTIQVMQVDLFQKNLDNIGEELNKLICLY